MGGFVLLTSVTMLYAAFGMDGEEQARLVLVIGTNLGLVCRLLRNGIGIRFDERTDQDDLEGNAPR